MAEDSKSRTSGAQAAATASVIAAFGGLRPMAKKVGIAVSTLQGWQTRGQIPAVRRAEISAAAERESVSLDSGALEIASGQAAPPAGGEASVRTTPGGSGDTPSGRVAEEAEAASPHPAGAPESRATDKPEPDHSAEEKPSGALSEGDDGPAHERPEVAETRTTGGVEAASESLTGSAASPEPAPPPAAVPQQRSATGPMLLGALLIALGLAIAVIGRDVWLPWFGIGGNQELEASVSGLQLKVTQLEEQLAGQDPGLTETDVSGLLDQRLAALNAKFAGLAEELQTLETAASSGADQAAVAALRGDLEALSAEVSDLAGQLSQRGSGGEAALVLALVQLRDALRQTAAYEAPLAGLEQRLGGDAEALSASLETLGKHAANGLATRRLLAERFPAVAREIASAGYAEDESWYGGILRRVNQVISIRPVGEDVAGEDPAAVAARAEAKVKAGDLRGAVAELETLTGAPAEAAAGWLAEAQARLAAEAALAEISAAASRRLAPSGSGQ